VEVLRRFFEEVAFVEYGGSASERPGRLAAMRGLAYNDLAADRNTVAVVQSLEAILRRQANGQPGSMVEVNATDGGLILVSPGSADRTVLYAGRV
jgi:hypothetical protein